MGSLLTIPIFISLIQATNISHLDYDNNFLIGLHASGLESPYLQIHKPPTQDLDLTKTRPYQFFVQDPLMVSRLT